MPYRAPVSDFQFIFDHVVDLEQVTKTDLFAEASRDVTDAILIEAGKLCEEVMAPVQRNGDLHPAVLENGVVRSSPGFSEAYQQIAEGGWVGMSADVEHGGMGLPITVTTAVNEMMSAACLSLQLNPLLTMGQIEALEHHASDEMKALYLPKLISGEWNGTMNLTEPHAGTDVGALSSKAEPNGDGTYAVTGQKIFISWGDSDMNTNTCHLVLARLPDGAAGTRGISLFMVPKFIPDENGNPGVANTLKVVSLEHKMGLHGSPTAVMQFDGAKGWLVGEEHKGMAAMFTMMNNARLGVGVQGIGAAEGAYQQAVSYAMDRKQSKTPVGDGAGTIVDHADVRRMLATMKAEVFAARAISLACAASIDLARATGDADHQARAALLTPIAKAYGTDTGINVSSMGIQVHGGMGFIEETGAAQYLRDVRVTAIYEGTNGIQAMDLVARKMMDGGEAAFRLSEEIETAAEAARGSLPELAEDVWGAAEDLRETTEWMVAQDMNDRFAGAVPYLRGFALALGAHFHLKAAVAEGADGPRTALARFFIKRILPEHNALFAHAREGAEGLYALSPEDLVA
ncbi:acyl-CoA dehydrogenase [Actibacterium lipolyticum]|uniref:3-methylmercaptopropionyl-CoA dehydrogenase n=1 Tax=Actibacterium lipolyticum TaxID=1524263 RepID=A0A238KSH2_9RHOB|nr:acyl-CoA dehydrogenase [Actibacterium lipolyticum]SMX45765.1 Acyl-CoA dehydrogenase, short-chain specific [Actibacterium lipolyticum]